VISAALIRRLVRERVERRLGKERLETLARLLASKQNMTVNEAREKILDCLSQALLKKIAGCKASDIIRSDETLATLQLIKNSPLAGSRMTRLINAMAYRVAGELASGVTGPPGTISRRRMRLLAAIL